jgi:hypothetical protein
MIQRTVDRVPAQTDPRVNDAIRRATEARIIYFERHPEEIPWRLEQLDREWDIERVLETGSASLSLGGLLLGMFGRRRWLLVPLAVQGFFMQHALQGWCPPLPLFRRLGVRTVDEIDFEREALLDLMERATQPERRGEGEEGMAAREPEFAEEGASRDG